MCRQGGEKEARGADREEAGGGWAVEGRQATLLTLSLAPGVNVGWLMAQGRWAKPGGGGGGGRVGSRRARDITDRTPRYPPLRPTFSRGECSGVERRPRGG